MSIPNSGNFDAPPDFVDVPPDFELTPDEPGLYSDAWPQGELSWQLHFQDGDERKWVGYIDGEPAYWVHRGVFGCVFGPDWGDCCDTEMEGINACEVHHKYGPEGIPRSNCEERHKYDLPCCPKHAAMDAQWEVEFQQPHQLN